MSFFDKLFGNFSNQFSNSIDSSSRKEGDDENLFDFDHDERKEIPQDIMNGLKKIYCEGGQEKCHETIKNFWKQFNKGLKKSIKKVCDKPDPYVRTDYKWESIDDETEKNPYPVCSVSDRIMQLPVKLRCENKKEYYCDLAALLKDTFQGYPFVIHMATLQNFKILNIQPASKVIFKEYDNNDRISKKSKCKKDDEETNSTFSFNLK